MKNRAFTGASTGFNAVTPQMMSTPRVDVVNECKDCDVMQQAIKWGDMALAECRRDCMRCQDVRFAFDAIYAAVKASENAEKYANFRKNANVGKKATRHKTHGHAVHALRREGRTLREIADVLDISIGTVRGILKEKPLTNIG